MYKLIDSASFFPEDEVTVNIIDPGNSHDLIKSAADSRVSDFVSDIEIQPGKFYIHVLAMGAGEFWGANRNADYFPENNLLDYYKTFETSPAHVFRHHINKDPAKAIGRVLFAVYNERMHRVELVAEVDKELGQDIESKIALGQYPSTSMACKTPYDVCSICGNKASTRQEYCSHLTTMMGKMLPDGRKVMALNLGPLKFFDISIVIRPADVTSTVLQKVAYDSSTFSSAELAEAENLSDERVKTASFNKLSEFIKQIEGGQVIKANPQVRQILNNTRDPGYEIIDALNHAPLGEIIDGFAELGMSPSLKFLSELISRRTLKEEGFGLGEIVNELLAEVGVNNIELPNIEFGNKVASPLLVKALVPYVEGSSLMPQFVEKRASEIGYAVLSNHIIPSAKPEQVQSQAQKYTLPEMIRALLTIGGAALLAKWYINKSIEEKLASQRENNVKIILTKKASDTKTLRELCKAAMEQVIVIKPASNDQNSVVTADRVARKLVSEAKTPFSKKLSAFLKVFSSGKKIISNEKKEA